MAFSPTDVLTLAKAGFSASQIAALSGVVSGGFSGAPPDVSSTSSTSSVSFASSVAIPAAQEPPTIKQPPTMEDILRAVGDLKATVTAAQIAASNQPPTPTVDDVLASVINPPAKGGGANGG